DRDCSDFASQRAAQDYFLSRGGPDRDPDRLDADGDGVACESLPCPCRNSTRRSPPRRERPRALRIPARVTEVVDGDTIRVRATGGPRRRYTVRLIGIDTRETKRPGRPVECGGREASSNMLRLAFSSPRDTDGDGLLDAEGGAGRRVTLTTDPTQDRFDRFRRLLAYAQPRSGGQLNVAQVAAGWSRAYVFRRRFQQYGRFKRAEAAARAERRGAWGLCAGEFHRPA
nr:thermonuclease family protein [Actinomycetota bacterium]